MHRKKRLHYFPRNSNLFHSIVSCFYYIYQKFIKQKYMLLVIDYVNFGTCPTILAWCPTIFIGIPKVFPNNYVRKVNPTYLFYIYLFFFILVEESLGKIFGSKKTNGTWFESSIKHKLKLVSYSNESKSLISE